MAYASQVQNDTQHQPPVSFNTKLCLFGGNLECDWEGLLYRDKAVTPKSSNDKTTMIGLQPIMSRQVQTLASLESNCISSEDEEEMEEELEGIDQFGGYLDPEEELQGEEEIRDGLDAEDENNGGDDEYVDFCRLLTKSPARDAAVSQFVHASFVSSSFSFALTNDEDSSEGDNEDDTDDSREETNESHSDDEEFSWFAPQTNTCLGGFDPFAVSGLFIPSLLSALTSVAPSHPGNSSRNPDDDKDWNEELAQKLNDINRRWLETYSSSSKDKFTVVDAENCIDSEAVKVINRKTVHFCDKPAFIDILNEEEWAEDYETARKGPWEQYHRDHMRFTDRIESMRELLSEVFVAEHRTAIFRRLHEAPGLVANGQDSPMDDLLLTPLASS